MDELMNYESTTRNSTHNSSSFFPGSIFNRQIGRSTPNRFDSDVLRMKLGQLGGTKMTTVCFQELYGELGGEFRLPLECRMLSPSSDCFVGAWTRGKYPNHSLYISEFHTNPKHAHAKESPIQFYPTYYQVMGVSSLMRNCDIVDICAIDSLNYHNGCILNISKSMDSEFNYLQIVPRKNCYHPESYHLELGAMRLEMQIRLFSCTWNSNIQRFALGTNCGVIINSMDSLHQTSLSDSIPVCLNVRYTHRYVQQFNSCGNVLHFGFSDGYVAHVDTRNVNKKLDGATNIGECVSNIKLLEDDLTVIASGENKLCHVDTRMNSVVFTYSGDWNAGEKTTFHIDESIGVVCSSGKDYVTRFWNLKSGELLSELQPTFLTKKGQCIYSATKIERRKIYAYIFSGDEVHCLEPVLDK